jgi:hypothetical protein
VGAGSRVRRNRSRATARRAALDAGGRDPDHREDANEDRIIPRNPCRIWGGGDEKAAERPVLTVAQVFDLAIMPAFREHFAAYVGPQESDLVFTGARGGVLRRGNFRRGAGWASAVGKAGAPRRRSIAKLLLLYI